MANDINISEYNPDETFTVEVAKQIVKIHGADTLDVILMHRLRERYIKGD